jgi:hypothetical protein
MRANVLEQNIGGGIYTIDHNCAASASQTVDIPSSAPQNGYAIACMGATNASSRTVQDCDVSGSVITVTLSGAAGANDDLTVLYFGGVGSKSTD